MNATPSSIAQRCGPPWRISAACRRLRPSAANAL
jgi:hypothetical protein